MRGVCLYCGNILEVVPFDTKERIQELKDSIGHGTADNEDLTNKYIMPKHERLGEKSIWETCPGSGDHPKIVSEDL
ncbi:hypothetical protein KKE60_07195 [Patescibacteria group bacterium]|nr:hypothetical protein [Patescibacteria group bacterium]